MSTLHPTPSRSSWLRRMPWWGVAVVIGLLGVALVGTGLLLFDSKGGPSAAAKPGCTPTPVASATATPAGPVRINVYNATDRSGLAGLTATSLGHRGFTVATVANDPKSETVTGTALVRYGPSATAQARWLAAQVEGAKLVAVKKSGDTVDLVLGDAYAKLSSKKTAQTAYVASAPTTGC